METMESNEDKAAGAHDDGSFATNHRGQVCRLTLLRLVPLESLAACH